MDKKKNVQIIKRKYIRDRPFNLKGGLWFFVSFRIFFSDNTRVRIFFFCHTKRKIFFQNSTLGYMTKTLNQNIFFSNIGNQNIFLEKNQVKWSFPNDKYRHTRDRIIGLEPTRLCAYSLIPHGDSGEATNTNHVLGLTRPPGITS